MGVPTSSDVSGVTFLFTDVEGSTRLWDLRPADMPAALTRHDDILSTVIVCNGGHVVKPRGEGDSIFAVFPDAAAAVIAAAQCQLALAAEHWPNDLTLRVRMALHTGEAVARDGDYYGPAINRCARIRGLGHGGQVLMSSATAHLIRDSLGDRYELVDLGLVRLRDITAPEQVFQLNCRGLPQKFPPLRVAAAATHVRLPLMLTSFLGREAEISALEELISGTRLVTVVGPGGVGKTRLAIEVARRTAARWEGGVSFVDLSSVTMPSSVPLAIAGGLGVSAPEVTGLLTAVADRFADAPALLVLDNCEQVLAGIGDAVTQLLENTAGVHVLATSRSPLSVYGEAVFPLGPFAEVDGAESGQQWPAVRLFVERARHARPGHVFDDADLSVIAQICRRLDGLPLAVELAAARITSLSPARLNELLHEALGQRGNSARPRTDRHADLQAVVEWSYRLLSPVQRWLFRTVSVFDGPFSHTAAAHVAELSGSEFDTISRLDDLARHSLLTVDPARGLPYSMLETVRQAGRTLLRTAGEEDDLLARHSEYMTTLLASLDPRHLDDQAIDVAMAMIDDVRSALARLVDTQHTSAAADASWHAQRLWRRTGRLAEGRYWHTRVLDALEPSDLLAVSSALVLIGRAELACRAGELRSARADAEQALGIATATGDEWVELHARYNLGFIALGEGSIAEADLHGVKVTEIADRLGGRYLGTVAAWLNSSRCRARHDLLAAEGYLRLARDRSEGIDPDLHLMARMNLGELLFDDGRLAEAETELDVAYSAAVRRGNDLVAVESASGQCAIALRRGDTTGAGHAIVRAFQQANDVPDMYRGLLPTAAYIAVLEGNAELASQLHIAAKHYATSAEDWDRKRHVDLLEKLNPIPSEGLEDIGVAELIDRTTRELGNHRPARSIRPSEVRRS